MAKIDKMLDLMSARGVDQALLVADRTIQFHSSNGIIDGPHLTTSQLQEALSEIIPPSFFEAFQNGIAFQFVHQAPSGTFNILVQNYLSSLQATITPLQSPNTSSKVEPLQSPPVPSLSPSPWNSPAPAIPSNPTPPSLPSSPYSHNTSQPNHIDANNSHPLPGPAYSQPAPTYSPPPPSYPQSSYPPQGYPLPGYGAPTMLSYRSRVAGGLLGIFLGCFGVHRFYLGHTTLGVIYLLATLVLSWPTCGVSAVVVSIIGLIEGIIILTGGMKDAEGRDLAP